MHRIRRRILVLVLLLGWLGQAWSPHIHRPEAPEHHHASQIASAHASEPHSCGSAGEAGDGRHEGAAEHLDCMLCRSSREWRSGLAAAPPRIEDPSAAAPRTHRLQPGHGHPPEAPHLAGNPSRAPPHRSLRHV